MRISARLVNGPRQALPGARQSSRARVPGAWRRCGARKPVGVVAFQASGDTVALPIDYFKCFGVPRAASRDAVRKAYERLLASPPDVGYSQDALFSRAVLLKNASD